MKTLKLSQIPTRKLNIACRRLSQIALATYKHNRDTYGASVPNPCMAKCLELRKELDAR